MAITWKNKNRNAAEGSHESEWRDDDANQVKREIDNLTTYVTGSTVVVNKKGDLPAPVGGVITLLPNTTYRIAGAINLGTDRINSNGGILIGLTSANDTLTYIGTGTMFTCTTEPLEITRVGIFCTNGQFVDMDAGANARLFLDTMTIDCKTGGTINNAQGINFLTIGFKCADSGFVFTGHIGTLNVQSSGFTAMTSVNGLYFDMTGATFNLVCYCAMSIVLVNNQSFFSNVVGSTNVFVGFSITDCFTYNLGTGATIIGTLPDDPIVDSAGNRGIVNSKRVGSAFVEDGNEVNTAISGGSGDANNPITLQGGFTDNDVHGFDHDGFGLFTYQAGQPTAHFSIRAGFNVDTASGTNRVYWFYIVINGLPRLFSRMEQSLDSADPQAVSLYDEIELSAGDTVEIWVECRTGTTDIIASAYQIMIF